MLEEVHVLMEDFRHLAEASEVTYDQVFSLLNYYQVPRNVGKQISQKQYAEIKKALTYQNKKFGCGFMDVPFYKSVRYKGFTTYDFEDRSPIEGKGTIYLSFIPSMFSKACTSIVKFLVDQRIASIGKLSLIHENIMLRISFAEGTDAIAVRNYIWKNLKSSLAPHHPFIPDYKGVGLIPGEEIPYTELLSDYLVTYINACRKASRLEFVTFERFYKTLQQSYERNSVDDPYLVHQVLTTLEHIH